MTYDFDSHIPRLHTHSTKHDSKTYYNIPEDAIPLWVADMDFATAPCVTSAIQKRAQHPIYGYTFAPDSYFEAICNWMASRHNWQVEKDWIVPAPSIVTTFNLICQAFLQPGDSVLVQNPVYHPFKASALNNGMHIVNNPLRFIDGRYEIDFEDFEKQVNNPQVKLFILCNPHNPVGRVWTCGELRKMGELCQKHDVLMISDEIHQDLVYKGSTFTSMGSISKEISSNLIVCTSPGKTFNLPSISYGNIIIPNPTLRSRFKEALQRIAFESLSPFAVEATTAAYSEGAPWVDALMDYLADNKAYIENFIATHLPMLHVLPCEATYLLWIDCTKLGMEQEALIQFLTHECKLWINSGAIFGEEGTGFIRMNIATQRTHLIQAMKNLRIGIQSLHL